MELKQLESHNPYFNRWFSAIKSVITIYMMLYIVTILILIDGFLQSTSGNPNTTIHPSHNPYFNRWFSAILRINEVITDVCICHNPYFNRWFSAMMDLIIKLNSILSHNPYFNRWFSAIDETKAIVSLYTSHNPYFNRWFSAIEKINEFNGIFHLVTILILIDGFLQFIVI